MAELPDYEELMRRIAELNATDTETSNYLYEKDVYNPDEDPELLAAEDETAATDSAPIKSDANGFELPDFLKDIQEKDCVFPDIDYCNYHNNIYDI